MVMGPLVVHGGYHGDHGLAVGKGQHGDLRAGEKFLNDHLISAVAEGAVQHDGFHGGHGVLPGLSDEHTLAQSQTVGLDHHGQGAGLHIVHRGGSIGEHLILRRGDPVFFHQVLGKDLAALNDGGLRLRAEAGDPSGLQRVHRTQHQRIVRRHHGEVNAVGLGKVHLRGNILRADLRDAHSVSSDAAVAGSAVDRLHSGILFQFFDDGVLTAAAADNQKVHGSLPE